MKKLFLVLFLSLFTSPLSQAFAASVECRGKVEIPLKDSDAKIESYIYIVLDNSEKPKYLKLDSPITFGTEQSFVLDVMYAKGNNIMAIYQVSPSSFISFKIVKTNQNVILKDFKGFEDNISFGPTQLVCN